MRAHIAGHLDERLTLDDLAPVAGLSPTHLQRSFKAALGLSPREYVKAMRTERFKSEVRAGRSVTDALYEAGYGSGSRLYEDAADRLGMTPGAYKRGGAGQVIRYTTAASALGRLLVAATDRGVCAVQIADSDGALEEGLRHDYPRADLRRDEKALRPTLAAILAHLGGEVPALDLPLDLTGTDFQGQVWRALQDIPRGETRSYAQVAQAVGRPRAVRAVARACASNRVALLIPCHRVVRGRRLERRLPLGSGPQAAAPGAGAGAATQGRQRPWRPLTSRRASRGSTGRGSRRTWARGPTPVSALCSRPRVRAISSRSMATTAASAARWTWGGTASGRASTSTSLDRCRPSSADLRTLAYERLAPIANGWASSFGPRVPR